MEETLAWAVRDAGSLMAAGFHGVLLENYGDAPFFPGPVPPETVAAMAVVVREVVQSVSVPVGVNVLRNDASAALAVSAGAGAAFIRVNVHTGSMFTDQGLVQGRAHDTLRLRRVLGMSIAILADVMVKHAVPPAGVSLEASARDSWQRGLADGLILTGTETGDPVDPDALARVRKALPSDGKVWIGSGVRPETAAEVRVQADGIIVGSALKEGGRAGNPVDPARARAFMDGLA
jgi:membrane complex biogenesis BtpA family protein